LNVDAQGDPMKRLATCTVAMLIAAITATSAQRAPFNAVGITMGHWHLNSRDIEANKKIFVALGGVAAKPGDFDIVKFPDVVVFLQLRAGSPPSTGGSIGTVIDHGGFNVPNVQAAVAKWNAAGVAIQPGLKGRTDQAFIFTGDGLKIEILEDKTQTVPIRHHHVHYHVLESEIDTIRDWYIKIFGATPSMRAGTAVQYKTALIPGAELTFSKSDKPTVPTLGRVLDHIGFDVKNMDETVKRLEAAGIKLDRPVLARPDGSKLTFIHDPWGASIELNERPNPL
jgi:catechol 2,3-dioxygenase-like lactoylglutathione lyase family enzyme